MEWLVASDLDVEECSALLALFSSQMLHVEADETFFTYAHTAERIHARGPRSWLRAQQCQLSGGPEAPAVAAGSATRLVRERRLQKQQQQQSGEQQLPPLSPRPPPSPTLNLQPHPPPDKKLVPPAQRRVKHLRRLQGLPKAGWAYELLHLDPHCLGLLPADVAPETGGATLYARRMMLPSTLDA